MFIRRSDEKNLKSKRMVIGKINGYIFREIYNKIKKVIIAENN